jgi:hypothetical protein
MHPGVALFGVAQTLAHEPQFFGSVPVATSHPSFGILLQSWKPVLQVPMAQLPSTHMPAALAGAQLVAQPPQWLVSAWRSTHCMLQQVRPEGHAWSAVQPGTQLVLLVSQTVPGSQSESIVQPWQVLVAVLHVRVEPPSPVWQSALVMHPVWHISVAEQ